MTRRSPTTWPVHLTRHELELAIEAVLAQLLNAETPTEHRRWKRISNRLARARTDIARAA